VENRPTSIFDGGCLLEEGGNPEITPELLLESFSRQFLAWLNLWAEEGLSSVVKEFSGRSDPPGTPVAILLGNNQRIAGLLDGADGRGRLQLQVDEKRRTVSIRRFLGLPEQTGDDA